MFYERTMNKIAQTATTICEEANDFSPDGIKRAIQTAEATTFHYLPGEVVTMPFMAYCAETMTVDPARLKDDIVLARKEIHYEDIGAREWREKSVVILELVNPAEKLIAILS
jgi:hypothetical protein